MAVESEVVEQKPADQVADSAVDAFADEPPAGEFPGEPASTIPNEWILRRIHKNHCNADLPHAIHFAAFRPSKSDITGLSVFRELEISATQVAAAGKQSNEYFVARLSMQSLQALGLTVIPEDDPDGAPGHAVIPELNVAAYEQNKQLLKNVLMELARIASQNIVHCPMA